MLALQIYKHAVLMLWNNRLNVIRITLLPWLVILGMVGFMNLKFKGEFSFNNATFNLTDTVAPESFWLYFLALAVIISVIFTWIVITWHRFVLLEKSPARLLPEFDAMLILRYMGNSALISLTLIIPMVLFALVGAKIIGAMAGTSSLQAIPFQILLSAVISLIFYRFALALPASAIAKPIGLGGSWYSTSGKTGVLLQVAVITAVIGVAIPMILPQQPDTLIIGFAVTLVNSLSALVQISLLTTMYGLWEEGREL